MSPVDSTWEKQQKGNLLGACQGILWLRGMGSGWPVCVGSCTIFYPCSDLGHCRQVLLSHADLVRVSESPPQRDVTIRFFLKVRCTSNYTSYSVLCVPTTPQQCLVCRKCWENTGVNVRCECVVGLCTFGLFLELHSFPTRSADPLLCPLLISSSNNLQLWVSSGSLLPASSPTPKLWTRNLGVV